MTAWPLIPACKSGSIFASCAGEPITVETFLRDVAALAELLPARGNVVNPEDVIHEFGADSLRLFEMFMGPLQDSKPWSTAGVQGVHRFLSRVWRLVMEEDQEGRWSLSPTVQTAQPTPAQILLNEQLYACSFGLRASCPLGQG